MSIRAVVLLILSGALGPSVYAADPAMPVPLHGTSFAWVTIPANAQHSAPTKHTIVCADITVEIEMPRLSYPIDQVIPGPGTYQCSVFASNEFSRQAEPNVPFPKFQAGLRPMAPGGTHLQLK